MKSILTIVILLSLVVSGLAQTRNVVVGTNGAVVSPTNFWSADVTNARSGLGLGSAATNPASAFQPSSATLSNLSLGNGADITNITAGISSITGLQSALDGKLGTNPTLAIANISNLQTTLDGKLTTNPTLQISNIAALQTALDGKISGSLPIAISNVSGLQTSLDGKLATNPTLAIANITGLQTDLDSKLSLTGNAVNLTNFPTSLLRVDGSAASLTNFPASLLRTTGDASGLTNFPTLNQNTTGTASNVTGIVAIANGGSGANTASGARTAFGLGSAATNPASAFQPASTVLSNLANNNGGSLTNITAANIGTVALASNITGTAPLATNVTGVVALVNGGTGATNASGARTALGVSASDVFVGLTNLGTGTGQGFASTPYILGSTNSTTPNNAVLALNAAGVRSVAGLTLAALTNTDNAAFRSAIGLGTAATNPATAFQPSSSVLTNLAANNGGSLTNITASNVTGTIAIGNGGSGATTAGGARTNLGLGATWLTNTNATSFRTAIGLGDWATLSDGGTLRSENLTIGEDGASDVIQFTGNGGVFFFGNRASQFRTALGLGWSALTNSNTATSLLGFTANGQIVANTGTNVLTVTNSVRFEDGLRIGTQGIKLLQGGNYLSFYDANENVSALVNSNGWTFYSSITISSTNDRAETRTNLGLGWIALTNTNTAGFNASLYGSGTNPVLYNTNGEVVTPTNFWQVAPIVTRFVESLPTTNQTTNIAAGRNLHIHSIAPSTVGITNTIGLPTTGSFNGDVALVVHQGPTSSVTAVRTAGASTNLITLNQFEEAVEFVYYNSVWQFNHNQSFVEPIFFSGTNAAANAAASRTNLGLPLAALTNTSNANFRTAIGLGSTNAVTFQSVIASNVLVVGLEASSIFATDGTNSTTIVPTGVQFNGVAAATTRTNLGIPLAALTNTNNANFQAAIELGTTNNVTFNNITASGTLTSTGEVTTVTNLNVGGAIAVTNAAETRTNLGIPLAALTNTSNADFQAAIFNTNSVPTNSANVNAINFNTAIHWMEVNVVTNGATNNFRIPLFK